MRIAVIPARGGSKRIPGKNIRLFRGKPMIAWSIEVARNSGLFERVLVSTDDNEIAEVARAWRAEVPFVRPAELSTDHAGATAVIAHATRWALEAGMPVDAVCCLLATAPFTHVDDLRRGWDHLANGDWQFAFAATDFAAPIYRAFTEASAGGVEMVFPQHFTSRSQDLPRALHDAAQFYWGRPQAWLQEMRMFDKHSQPVIIPRWRVQDIDTEDDWARAELIAPMILEEARAVPHLGSTGS